MTDREENVEVNEVPTLRELLRNRVNVDRVAIAKYLATFVAGIFIGLVVLGWWLWPVQWTGQTFETLDDTHRNELVMIMSDHHAWSQSSEYTRLVLGNWGDEVACNLASSTPDLAEKARLLSLAYTLNGTGCDRGNE